MGFSSGTFTFTTSGLPVVTATAISSTVKNTQDDEIETGFTTCLLKDGTQTVTANIPMATFIFTGLGAGSAAGHSLRWEQLFSKGADIASATTTDLGAIAGLMHDITGTTTITGFGTIGAGVWKILKFEGALTLTHNATSLILLTGANRTTVAGDAGIYISEGSGNWRELSYMPVNTQLTNSGVKFAATQAASSDANTLDDYEEGTWTPSVGGNATYTTQDGTYTKIGRVVHIWMNLQINVLGTGSVSTVTGLPFTCNATTAGCYAVGNFSGLAVALVCIQGYTQQSATSIVFNGNTAGNGSATQLNIFQNAASIQISGSYHV